MKKFTDKIIYFLASISLFSMTLVVFIQVFFRYIFNNPLPWPEETARILIVWLTFLGAYLALKENRHVGFTVLIKKLSSNLQTIIYLIGRILMMIFFTVIIVEGILFVKNSAHIPMTFTGISTGLVVYTVFPISGFLMLIQTFLDTIKYFQNIKSNKT